MAPITFNLTIDGKAAERTVDAVSTAISTVFGPAAREFGLAWGERRAFFRYRQTLEIREKTVALEKQYPIKPEHQREIPEGEGIRALEAASGEDQPPVQDMWAGLLRNARDAETKITIEKVYVDLLKSLSAPEAVFLNALASANQRIHELDRDRRVWIRAVQERQLAFQGLPEGQKPPGPAPLPEPQPPDSVIVQQVTAFFEAEWRSYDRDLRIISLQNLIRLGLIAPNLRRKNVRTSAVAMPVDQHSRRTIELATPESLRALASDMGTMIEIAVGMREPPLDEAAPVPTNPFKGVRASLPEMQYRFLPLGRRLLRACSVPPRPEDAYTSLFPD